MPIDAPMKLVLTSCELKPKEPLRQPIDGENAMLTKAIAEMSTDILRDASKGLRCETWAMHDT